MSNRRDLLELLKMTSPQALGQSVAKANNIEFPVIQPKIAQQKAGFAGPLTRDQMIMRNEMAKGPI